MKDRTLILTIKRLSSGAGFRIFLNREIPTSSKLRLGVYVAMELCESEFAYSGLRRKTMLSN